MEDLWFIYDSYSYSGAPKLEAEVAKFARDMFMNTLVVYDDLPKLIRILERVQDDKWEENKRLKKVEIRLGKLFHASDDTLFIYIGSHTLRLRRVKQKLSFEEA